MPNVVGVARFVAAVALTYLALVAIVPKPPLAVLYRATGNLLFGHSEDRTVRFEPLPNTQGLHDTRIVIQFGRSGQRTSSRSLPVNSFHEAFAPLAVAVALALWTPVSLRDRCSTGALVFGAVVAFVFLRVALVISAGFANIGPGAEVFPATQWILRRANQVLGTGLELDLIVPIGLWSLAVARRWTPEELFSAKSREVLGAPAKRRKGPASLRPIQSDLGEPGQ